MRSLTHSSTGRRARSLLLAIGLVVATGLALVLGTIEAPLTDASSSAPIDLRANVFTTSAQEHASVAATPEGGLVAVWASRRQESGSYGVYARAFDAAGRATTDEVHVNVTERGLQHLPSVSADEHGVWFAWESIGQDGSGAGVVARRFDSELRALTGEIAVNSDTSGDQGAPVVASRHDGRALVVWSSSTAEGSEIHGRLLEADGRAAEPLELSSGADDSLPTVAALASGEFAVVWSRAPRVDEVRFEPAATDGTGTLAPGLEARPAPFEILARNVTSGGALAPETAVLGHGIEPTLAPDRRGGFVAAWLTEDEEARRIIHQRFHPNATPDGRAQRIDAGAGLSGVSLAVAADGRRAISYSAVVEGVRRVVTRTHAPSGRELETRLGSPDGPDGAESLTTTSGARRSAWTDRDLLVVAWRGELHGDSDGANLRLFGLREDATDPVRTAMAPETRSSDFLAPRPPIWNPDFVRTERLPAGEQIGGDFGFEAVPGTVWTPPDPEMAVGPEQIIVMTNGEITAFDKLGNEQWTDEIENTFGFWGELDADNFVFDPEATWDPHARRFVVMANEQSDDNRSYFLLAISKDDRPDDRDDWHKYRLDVTGIATTSIDSPNLGLSRDYILLTADFFGPDRYLFLVLDKSSVVDGGDPIFNFEFFSGAHSMGLPVVYSDSATLYAVQAGERFGGDNTEITLHGIVDPIDDYSRRTFELAVPGYVTFPADPPQKGSSVRPELFESRFWSVAERNGSLWAVHHVGSDRARVRWYEIDLDGWPVQPDGVPTLVDTGEINLGPGISTFFPSIHVDAAENVAITFARSASNEFFSIGRVLRAAGDPAGTFRPAQIVQTSQNAHVSGRWGDYSGTQADPEDADTFWGHHEFTDGNLTSWRTWVGRYDLLDEPMILALGELVAGQEATFEITGATPNSQVFLVFGFGGTGISEIGPLGVAVSVEGPLRFLSAMADGNGDATFQVDVPLAASGREITLQGAEANRTTNWEIRTIR